MSKLIPVMEIFGPTMQGEGLMTGTLTSFVRTGGCPLRCAWCDTMGSVDPLLVQKNASKVNTAYIIEKVLTLPYAPYCTLTGGDPCMHKDLGDIIPALNIKDIRVAVETQGTLFPDWLATCDVVTFSPKPPSSGNPTDASTLAEWITTHLGPRWMGKVCIKVVCFDTQDFAYALELYRMLPQQFYDAFYFTAGTFNAQPNGDLHTATQRQHFAIKGYRNLADHMLDTMKQSDIEFNHKVHVGCQQHVILWPHMTEGV